MLIIKIVYFIISMSALLYYFNRYKASPVTLFLAFQILMFTGIIAAPRAQTTDGKVLIVLYLCALICFLLGVVFRNLIRTRKDVQYAAFNRELAADPVMAERVEVMNLAAQATRERWQKKAVQIMLWVSIAACVYFFVAAGTNVFLQALEQFAAGENNNLSDDREGYFDIRGVGYIYQFRAILLPILTAYLVLTTKTKMLWKLLLAVAMLIFLLGTGQRNAFVFYAAIVFLYWIKLPKERRQFPKALLLGLVVAAALAMIILTIANGRVDSGESNVIKGAVLSLVDRVFNVNQETALFAFEYIQTQPTVWGYDWMMMMMDILPGKSGYLSVDRIVYYLAYGTYSGTGPPCLWGSAWYNFSYFGVTVFPFIMGYAYQSLYKWYQRQYKEPMILLIYTALSLYLGIWFYGTPMTLFNNGVVTVWLLYLVLYRMRVKFD